MVRVFLAIAAVLGGTAVAAGAFGSHALKTRLSDRALEIFDLGTRYQMYHALALLFVALLLLQTTAAQSLAQSLTQSLLAAAGIAFMTGVVIFSGSLYALSLTGVKWLGAVTPLGGVALMVGWGCLAIAALKFKP
jgi:uncharacterized membrane protein YgdD (TMEM256/DUF423 family)